jgi:hypothetical protein
MTYQLKKKMEFDVFNYVKNSNTSNGKVYVKIDKLLTRNMLIVLLNNKLPEGTYHNLDYFIFENADVCLKSVCEMYKTLQKMESYNTYCTLCLSMLEDKYEQECIS